MHRSDLLHIEWPLQFIFLSFVMVLVYYKKNKNKKNKKKQLQNALHVCKAAKWGCLSKASQGWLSSTVHTAVWPAPADLNPLNRQHLCSELPHELHTICLFIHCLYTHTHTHSIPINTWIHSICAVSLQSMYVIHVIHVWPCAPGSTVKREQAHS